MTDRQILGATVKITLAALTVHDHFLVLMFDLVDLGA